MMSEEQRKKKFKFLLVAPVIVAPFLTLVFWALGDGSVAASDVVDGSPEAGINTELPGAKNKDDAGLDKMGFYELAEQDSLKRKEARENDPYANDLQIEDSSAGGLIVERDQHEEKVYAQLERLNKELENHPSDEAIGTRKPMIPPEYATRSGGDVERLEKMLAASREKDSTVDGETVALNNMLERILDIQHPDRVRERIAKASAENKGLVLPVYVNGEDDILAKEGVFLGDTGEVLSVVIPGEIAETRVIYNGATVKMRLLSEVFIMGKLIPRNSFVSGIVSFDELRMHIVVSSIYHDNNIFPVQLAVYDGKGIKGLELQANVQHELARQSGERGVSGMNITSLDPSIGGQAVSAGIDVAKNVLSKKFRQIKVPVKAGEKILLVSQ